MKIEVIFRTSIQLTYYSDSAGLLISLQEAESKMRMMQQKLRQEEKDLMWSSCETTRHIYSQSLVTKSQSGFINSLSCSER